MRRGLTTWLLPLLAGVLVAGVQPRSASPATAPSAAAFPDSLLLAADDFETLRSRLLPLTSADVADIAWELVPRLIELDRPDLLLDFLEFWEDRCGTSEPTARTRILAAIWDGAFDESLYDERIGGWLEEWEGRDPSLQTAGRRVFDAFMIAFADQLLPHQPDGSLTAYFCLVYSDRTGPAATLLAEDLLTDTWLRWYRDHPDGLDEAEGTVIDADAPSPGVAGPTTVLLTVGGWWPRGEVELAGDHVSVGGLIEQRLGSWSLRIPIEVRLGRTTRPYLVEQDGVRGRSDRFDALYLGVEAAHAVATFRALWLEAFGGLGYDGIRPFLERDVMLATLNANLGLGVRWRAPRLPVVLGLDLRREWLATRNEGADSLAGGAWSLRFGAGFRFAASDPAVEGSR